MLRMCHDLHNIFLFQGVRNRGRSDTETNERVPHVSGYGQTSIGGNREIARLQGAVETSENFVPHSPPQQGEVQAVVPAAAAAKVRQSHCFG